MSANSAGEKINGYEVKNFFLGKKINHQGAEENEESEISKFYINIFQRKPGTYVKVDWHVSWAL